MKLVALIKASSAFVEQMLSKVKLSTNEIRERGAQRQHRDQSHEEGQ